MQATTTAAAPQVARWQGQRPPGALRVTGSLTADACVAIGTSPTRRVLLLSLQPAVGLPYQARVDLGDDLADHMAAEALLPQLRTGAVVSVAGTHLDLRTDHGHAVLVVRGAHNALLLRDPLQQPHPPSA